MFRGFFLLVSILAVLLQSALIAGFRTSVARPGYPPPKCEVRAVWITTVAGLDWPPSWDRDEQRRSLDEAVNSLAAAGFNTIYFQVRGRADAVYRSAYEPWSQQLTGTLGQDPGWDPLQFLIDRAHARGLEVHAWFNTFLVKTGGPKPPATRPRHILLEHPDWMREAGGEIWCDPGLPDVRSYLVRIALDIVRRYDIDGIQFDYARYPNRPFPDDAAFQRYGRGATRDDWRRGNVNAFIRTVHDSIYAVKPWVKVGAAPIGIYNASSGARGLRGYSDVFQDSRRWLREGWVDYLVPQIYWAFADSRGDPDFAVLAREWAGASDGRHVFMGTGPYKPEVLRSLPQLIDSARAAGASGVSFFRLENIRNSLRMGGRFGTPALVPAMTWKDSVPPNPPQHPTADSVYDGIVTLGWQAPAPASDGDTAWHYAVYRSPKKPVRTDTVSALVAVLVSGARQFTDTIRSASAPAYYYAVTALDRVWNESAPAVEGIVLPAIVRLAKNLMPALSVGPITPGGGSPMVLIPYEVDDSVKVVLRVENNAGVTVVTVVDSDRRPGWYIAAVDMGKFPKGRYTCILTARGASVLSSFTTGS